MVFEVINKHLIGRFLNYQVLATRPRQRLVVFRVIHLGLLFQKRFLRPERNRRLKVSRFPVPDFPPIGDLASPVYLSITYFSRISLATRSASPRAPFKTIASLTAL